MRNASLSCLSANGFDRLQHVKVPDTLNAIMVGGKSLDDCKELCLKNCSCSAYALLGGSNCIVWSGDLVDVVLFVDGIDDLYTRVSHNNHSHPGTFRLSLTTQEEMQIFFLSGEMQLYH